MKILVINGSPKGKYSITLQTFKYLEKLYPKHKFSVLDAGQKIKAFEKDFSAAKEAIENATIAYRYTLPYLENELKGYKEYKKKVKYRLIPFIW